LLKQLKRAVRDHELLDEHRCFDRANVAYSAASDLANTLALVPPKGAEEALAAAALLFGEAASLECFGQRSEMQQKELILRMKQRAATLTSWIETTHKVDRRDFRLDYFCPAAAQDEVLPHTAASLNVNEPSAVA
jgi:hypothetical protein